MPSPQAWGRSGRAAASATPARIPTLESSAEETTAGSPQSPTTSRARTTPPSGATLTTTRSAASSRATRSGSSALRIDSSAAIRTSIPLCARAVRTSRSSSTLAHGCSTYSSPKGASRVIASTAWSTDQPPLASSRTAPPSPMTSRTAATRSTSSARDCPRSATLTLAVSHPSKRAMTPGTASGATAGTVALHGISSRRGVGQPMCAASTAAASQRLASGGSYSRKGANSPHPIGPRMSATSRCSTPRKRTRRGIETTRSPSRRSSTGGSEVTGRGWRARRTRCPRGRRARSR